MSNPPDPNQPAERNLKRIGGFFLGSLLVLGAFLGYRNYRESNERAAAAASAKAEAQKNEDDKKSQAKAAADAAAGEQARIDAKNEMEAKAAALVREQAELARQAAAKLQAETEKQQRIRGFVSPAYLTKVPGTVALVVLDSQQNYDPALSERFSELLRQSNILTDWKVFRPAFIASENFKRLLAGNYSPDDSFKPDAYCERLVCIRTRSSAVRITEPADLISTEFVLTVLVIAPETRELLSTTEVKGGAVGFSERASLENAVDWAAQELTKAAPDLAPKIKPTQKKP